MKWELSVSETIIFPLHNFSPPVYKSCIRFSHGNSAHNVSSPEQRKMATPNENRCLWTVDMGDARHNHYPHKCDKFAKNSLMEVNFNIFTTQPSTNYSCIRYIFCWIMILARILLGKVAGQRSKSVFFGCGHFPPFLGTLWALLPCEKCMQNL